MFRSRPLCRFVNRQNWRAISDIYLKKPLPLSNTIQSLSTASSISPPSLKRAFFRFLKFGSLATLAATGYVSYAYTVQEVDAIAKSFRASNNIPRDDPLTPKYHEPYRSNALAEERDAKTINFRESANRDDDPNILGYYSSFVSSAKAVAAEAIDIYLNLRVVIQDLVKENFEPPCDKLLPDMHPLARYIGAYTIVLDLNETLVHSDWKAELYEDCQSWKRPGLNAFLERIRETPHELVLYTDELSLDVIPFLLSLENRGGFIHRLTRSSTKYQDGKRYRDLSKLNRDPAKVMYVSAHALENCLQPENCVPIKPWKKEVGDTTLMDLLPLIEYLDEKMPDDIRPILASFEGKDIPTECKYLQSQLVEQENFISSQLLEQENFISSQLLEQEERRKLKEHKTMERRMMEWRMKEVRGRVGSG